MTLIQRAYKFAHPKAEKCPYWTKYSLGAAVAKGVRKWFSVVVIPTIPANGLRVWMYRRCGYKIGRGVFIGMRCYLDDLCYAIGKKI